MISADSIIDASTQRIEKIFFIRSSDRAEPISEIEKEVRKIPGVKSAQISPATSKLLVTADTPGFDFSRVEEVIKNWATRWDSKAPLDL